MKRRTGIASAGALVRSIGALQSKTFDIAIVGGGIAGAGIARHAAKAGLSVVLLEEGDFSSGASSKSTNVTDGGLRDLALRDIRLARDLALERQVLRNLAPHLVEAITMIAPFRSFTHWITFRLDFLFYKTLGLFASSDQHKRLNPEELEASEPVLDASKKPYVWSYREYLIDDARLTIAALRDASRRGAECVNYVSVRKIEQRRKLYFLSARDLIADKDFSVRCRCVVNATGCWVQQLEAGITTGRSETDSPGSELSKSVHIAVPHRHLPINNLIFLEAADKRPIFAVPKGQVTYIGATDTENIEAPTRWPTVTVEEINYLLAPISNYFSMSDLSPADVVSSWAGLYKADPRSDRPDGQLVDGSRVWSDEIGVICVSLGRLSSFRSAAKATMELVGQFLGRSAEIEDESEALPGGDFSSRQPSDFVGAAGFSLASEVTRVALLYKISQRVALRLVRLYGAETEKVLGYSPRPISSCVFAEEVDWAVSIEGATSLEDVLYRRLRCVWFEPQDLGVLAPAVAEHMANILRWDTSEQRRQRVAFEERIAFDLAAVPLAG